jgi:hypothetical protein
MAGSLGIGLNLGASTSGGQGSSSYVIISGHLWELSGSELMPYPTGTVTDYNLAWDLDGTDYMPQNSPTTDGNWEVVSGELTPNAV